MNAKCHAMLNHIENTLDTLADPILPPGLNVHCFEMKKIGKGFKTINYEWHNTGVVFNYTGNDQILSQHTTLTKIKNDFCSKNDDTLFTCVIDGNLQAPSQIIQLIVECGSLEMKQQVSELLKPGLGLNFECLSYAWVDQLPQDVLQKLKEF